MADKHDISLRERKHAQTKLALLEAAIERFPNKSLDEISVKELCETIPISEVTFFNYFPKKTDLLIYLIELWSIEVAWHIRKVAEGKTNLEVIEELFDFAARRIEEYPSVMSETLAFFARNRENIQLKEVALAERLHIFPDLPGVEDIPVSDIRAIVTPYLAKAIESGELPKDTDLEIGLIALMTILYGVPMILHSNDSMRIGDMYRRQLRLLWSGLRADVR